MSKSFIPIAIALLAFGGLLLGFGQFMVAALFISLAVALGALGAIAGSRQARLDDPIDGMDPSSRSMFVPIRRLTREIEKVVAERPGSTALQMVGREAAEEARRIQDQVGKALRVRSELRKTLRVLNQGSDEAKAAASELGVDHEKSLGETIEKIEAGTESAKKALQEIRSRLASSVASEKVGDNDSEGLRESIDRLRTINASYDEATEFLENH